MSISKDYISVRLNESQLRERNRTLFTLLDMSTFLSASLSLEDVLQGALAKVLEYFDLNAGRIYLMEEGGESLRLAACLGIDAQGLERVKVTEGFTGKAARTRSFIAQRVSELEDEHRAAFLRSKGIQIVICVPLIALGQVLGVMNLASAREVPIDDQTIDHLIVIGNQIAVAANNARLYASLNEKIRELEQQKEAIAFFAYSVSHDLKSPTVGIHGLARRLHRQYAPALEGSGQLYCEQILKASEQIVRLVDHINGYIAAKKAPVHFEPVSLKEIADLIHDEFQEALTRRRVRWIEEPELPVIVADKLSIIRSLRNLVDNALKYGGEGLTEIRVAYEDGGDCHVLSVSDDGVALKVDNPEKLFQLFQRHRTSHGIEGTGLGLATVKEIAERHQGRVWVEAGQERSTTFHLALSKHLKARNPALPA